MTSFTRYASKLRVYKGMIIELRLRFLVGVELAHARSAASNLKSVFHFKYDELHSLRQQAARLQGNDY